MKRRSSKQLKKNGSLKIRLRKAIEKTLLPVHCAGCDEWGCGGWEEGPSQDDAVTRVLRAILKELRMEKIENG